MSVICWDCALGIIIENHHLSVGPFIECRSIERENFPRRGNARQHLRALPPSTWFPFTGAMCVGALEGQVTCNWQIGTRRSWRCRCCCWCGKSHIKHDRIQSEGTRLFLFFSRILDHLQPKNSSDRQRTWCHYTDKLTDCREAGSRATRLDAARGVPREDLWSNCFIADDTWAG